MCLLVHNGRSSYLLRIVECRMCLISLIVGIGVVVGLTIGWKKALEPIESVHASARHFKLC